jgi:hypothetical protein
MADSGDHVSANDEPVDLDDDETEGLHGEEAADEAAHATSDNLDDLAAFLMHRTSDPGVTEEQRYRTFALVSAYQDRDNPPEIQAEMREAALKFADHPDYRAEWRPR